MVWWLHRLDWCYFWWFPQRKLLFQLVLAFDWSLRGACSDQGWSLLVQPKADFHNLPAFAKWRVCTSWSWGQHCLRRCWASCTSLYYNSQMEWELTALRFYKRRSDAWVIKIPFFHTTLILLCRVRWIFGSSVEYFCEQRNTYSNVFVLIQRVCWET